jgi:hypothetical protein
MEGIVGKRILRCSDGHLFISSESARLLLSLHFVPRRLMRCPVDGRFRMMSDVNSKDLPESEVLRLIAGNGG